MQFQPYAELTQPFWKELEETLIKLRQLTERTLLTLLELFLKKKNLDSSGWVPCSPYHYIYPCIDWSFVFAGLLSWLRSWRSYNWCVLVPSDAFFTESYSL